MGKANNARQQILIEFGTETKGKMPTRAVNSETSHIEWRQMEHIFGVIRKSTTDVNDLKVKFYGLTKWNEKRGIELLEITGMGRPELISRGDFFKEGETNLKSAKSPDGEYLIRSAISMGFECAKHPEDTWLVYEAKYHNGSDGHKNEV